MHFDVMEVVKVSLSCCVYNMYLQASIGPLALARDQAWVLIFPGYVTITIPV